MTEGGVQFGEFVDAGAEFLLDIADTGILLKNRLGLICWVGMFGRWTYNRAGLPRPWLVCYV